MNEARAADMQEPLSRRRRTTRERLLDAAYEVFARDGVGAASLDAITKHAGFTRGAFYSNFASKDELLAALAVRENDRRLRQVSAGRVALERGISSLGGEQDVREVVMSALAEFLSWQQEDTNWLIIEQEIRLLAMRDNNFGRYLLSHRAHVNDELQNVFEHVLAQRGMRFTIDPAVATRMLLAIYIDATLITAMGGASTETMRDALIELLLRITAPIDTTTHPDPQADTHPDR